MRAWCTIGRLDQDPHSAGRDRRVEPVDAMSATVAAQRRPCCGFPSAVISDASLEATARTGTRRSFLLSAAGPRIPFAVNARREWDRPSRRRRSGYADLSAAHVPRPLALDQRSRRQPKNGGER